MSQTSALSECRLGTSLPYQRNTVCDTLFSGTSRESGAFMFIFQRPIVAPLVALVTVAMLVVLDTLVDLSALFR